MILIAVLSSLAVVVLAVITRVDTYRFAPLFLLPLIWGVYALRRRLHLHPLHYGLFVAAILLHMLGALGFYQKWPLPFSFDILVHAYFGFAATFVFFRAFGHHYPFLKGWQLRLLTVMFVMGSGALHEIMEFGSYLAMGEKGMLKETSYRFDTSRDLLDNFLGCLAALLLYWVHRRARGTPESETPAPADAVPAR